MPNKINLLPTEFAPTGRAGRFVNILRNVSFLALVLFLILISGALAVYIINSVQLSSSKQKLEGLKDSLKSLEATEQRLVLVKDRLTKAKVILGQEEAGREVEKLNTLVSTFASDMTITDSEISPGKTQLTLLSRSSTSLAQFLGTLPALNLYKKIEMVSLSFNPANGYLVSLKLSE